MNNEYLVKRTLTEEEKYSLIINHYSLILELWQ